MSVGKCLHIKFKKEMSKMDSIIERPCLKIQVTKMVQSNEERNNLGGIFRERFLETQIHKKRRVSPFSPVGNAVGPLRFINDVSLAVKHTTQHLTSTDIWRINDGLTYCFEVKRAALFFFLSIWRWLLH